VGEDRSAAQREAQGVPSEDPQKATQKKAKAVEAKET